jgi:hypothetical protein
MSTPETLTRELAALDDALAGRPVDPDLADLAELAVLVRDERPAPDPAFTRSLDDRVERGFPRTSVQGRAAGRKRFAFSWPKGMLPVLGVAASLLLVVVLVSSTPSGNDDAGGGGGGSAGAGSEAAPDTQSSGGGGGSAVEEMSRDDSGGASAGKSAPSEDSAITPAIGPLPEPPSPGDPSADGRNRRYVERSAQIVLATPPGEVDRAAADVMRVADDLNGYVVSSQITSGSGGQFELRVPERRLQRALSRLSGIGKVRERTQNAQDITGAVVSVQERLKDARTERGSLLRQLAAATTPNQTASIRARLRIVSRQIAAAKRDLRRVKTRARYSTVAVTLVADRRSGGSDDEDDGGAWTPGDALDDALRILEVSAGVLLVAAAVLLPVGLIALLVWLAARQAAQRRRERALDAV